MKYNRVTLYGIARQAPRIIKDEVSGELKKGILPISVVKSVRYTGDKSKLLAQNVPVIMSRKPEIIRVMEDIKEYDSISVKGVLVTEQVMKGSICPECGEKQQNPGIIVYTTPIFLDRIKSNASPKEAMDDLFSHMEISNEINLVGKVCNDPEKVNAMVKLPICSYQLAVRRTYRLDSANDTDFPYIKSFGDNADMDLKHIRKGTMVMVDGCIQARRITRTSVCTCCGKSYQWDDASMEVVPYETEYLDSFNSLEDDTLADVGE